VASFTLSINGTPRAVTAEGDTPLLWVLRDMLDLVGTKFGCGGGFCGACTVHINGSPRRACQVAVSDVGAARVTTIEGLSADGTHPVQRAWQEIDVAQCGYCQAGQMMTAAALLTRTPNPSEEEIGAAMSANLCRCGTYMRIRRAVRRAAELNGERRTANGERRTENGERRLDENS
jgi:isoquinoline 1-oxidoreductase alpha subunit